MTAPEGARYELVVAPDAERQLRRLRRATRAMLLDAIHDLAEDPYPSNSLPMRGRWASYRRLRVDAYRIVYRASDRTLVVLVVRVGHRADVYRLG